MTIANFQFSIKDDFAQQNLKIIIKEIPKEFHHSLIIEN